MRGLQFLFLSLFSVSLVSAMGDDLRLRGSVSGGGAALIQDPAAEPARPQDIIVWKKMLPEGRCRLVELYGGDDLTIDPASTCAVCLEDFNLRTQILTLKCQHPFCKPCISKCLEAQDECPLCRTNVLYQPADASPEEGLADALTEHDEQACGCLPGLGAQCCMGTVVFCAVGPPVYWMAATLKTLVYCALLGL